MTSFLRFFSTPILLSFAVVSRADAYFDDLNEQEKGNSISLSAISQYGSIEFLLSHPRIRNQRLSTLVYLSNDSSPEMNMIKSFKVSADTEANSKEIQYKKKIPIEDIMNGTIYPCTHKEGKNFLIISCDGGLLLFSSVYNIDSVTPIDKNYFQHASLKSIFRWYFSIIIRVSKFLNGSFFTFIKKYTNELPCVNCYSYKNCSALKGFDSQIRLCYDRTCSVQWNPKDSFNYKDYLWVEINITPKTMRFDLWDFYLFDVNSSKAYNLPLIYLTLERNQFGQILISLPVAGLIELAGTFFTLVFILRAKKDENFNLK
jgi:hypothetical protein